MIKPLAAFAFLALLALFWVFSFNTINERHAANAAEREALRQTMMETADPFPSDEEVARAHRGENPDPVFPDPCGLDTVLCEGEPGWTEE